MFKKKLLFLPLVLMLGFIIASCSQNTKTEEEYLNSAKSLLDSGTAKKDDNLKKESLNLYKEFLTKYPSSTKGIFVYNQIAGINFDLKNFDESIKTYQELAAKYPDTKDAKNSLFMVAFIYDETMKNKEKAITAYEEFLKKYPKDTEEGEKLSESATYMLQNLKSGSNMEDIIKKIEEQEKKSGTDKKEEIKTDGKSPQEIKQNKTIEVKPETDANVDTKK
jgi:tetratricopeptide (TPR) repeat protein